MSEISLIVPVYKVERYLNRCINGILSQTFTDFELILVDDGSPDKCGEICEGYAKKDSRIHVIHQKNAGAASARNHGLNWAFENSNSKWIIFADSDDLVHKKYIQQLYATATPLNVDVCTCNYSEFLDEKELKEHYTNETKLWSPEEIWCQKRIAMVVPWGKIYKKRLWEKIRYPVGTICEDEFTTHKILFECPKIASIENTLYFYRQTPDSVMRAEWTPRLIAGIYAFHKQFDYFASKACFNAAKISMRTCIEAIYDNIVGARRSSQNYLETIDNLHSLLRENLIKHGKFAGFNYYNAAVYYKEIYPLFSPVWDLFIFIRIMKTEGPQGIKQRLMERLKCLKSQ